MIGGGGEIFYDIVQVSHMLPDGKFPHQRPVQYYTGELEGTVSMIPQRVPASKLKSGIDGVHNIGRQSLARLWADMGTMIASSLLWEFAHLY